MKLLIIEDEIQLTNNIKRYLKKEHFICEMATDVKEAYEKLENFKYDCLILDITLPDGNGLHILHSIKENKRKEGVIILSAKHSVDDKIMGLKLGADDYLPKPFHLAELSARVNAIIRRKQFEGNTQLDINGLILNYDAKTADFKNKRIDLTRSEFELLLFLVSNNNKVITKKALAEHLSGDRADMFDNYDFIYAHVKNLKKKLHLSGCGDNIKTVYGIGYRFQQ